MRKIFIATIFFLFTLSLLQPSVSYAKKHLPVRKGVASGVGTSVRFRRDRLAIIVTFSNLKAATSVDYMLSYATRGTTQGAAGSLNPAFSGSLVSRELLFGTCSHGVCRYDYGITNAKLVINISLANGKKIIRTYRLRV